jgi:hypothetical protein
VAKRPDNTDTGSWSLAEELLERGDPLFVDELRRITDADRLGTFAARWYADRRPTSRQLLFAYLDLPLNAFRHEPLVKRLFKLAERAGDDEVMGRFLVTFDRCVRRIRRKRRHTRQATAPTRDAAQAMLALWQAEGAEYTNMYEWGGQFHLYGMHTEDAIVVPDGTAMPRGRWSQHRNPRTGEPMRLQDIARMLGTRETGMTRQEPITKDHRQKLEGLRLFSVATRNYLRRRTWRYFRKLGKQHPERYGPGVAAALKCYRDDDVPDGLALLDNWGLMHVLFHHSPVLQSKPGGWRLMPGRGLSELTPAPAYEALWRASPRTLIELLKDARCRPVRQWAVHMIKRDHATILQGLSPDELFGLLAHQDPAVAALAAEVLRGMPDLAALGVDRLLGLLETPNPETLEVVSDLLAARLQAARVTFEQAVRLAGSRPLPAARLGFTWLQQKTPVSEADCQALLGLAEAQAAPLRAEMVRWARGVLSTSPHFQPGWVLEYLDSRHADVRAEGWKWLCDEARAKDNVEIWQKLLESPYDDVRLLLIADLEKRTSAGADPGRAENGRLNDELLRFLWAAVLLNIHRGGRTKPVVVGQLVRRLTHRPNEAKALLPILAVALRSLRGPEWRAGLAGVVQVVERNHDLAPLVAEIFPELKLV